MKKSLFLLALFYSIVAHGQGNLYVAKMKENLPALDSAKTFQALQELTASFERIAEAEKTQWLPYYYAALSTYKMGWKVTGQEKDAMAEKSLQFLKKAQNIENNAELYCMEYMLAILQMTVDPERRYLEYGEMADKAAAHAKEMDASNPRIYLMEAITVLRRPKFLGGGKLNARPLFEKSLSLFAIFKPLSELHPQWGKEQAAAGLEECKKQ